MKLLLAQMLILITTLLPPAAVIAQSTWNHEALRICAEDTGWPPFSIPPNESNQRFSGYNADLLSEIFSKRDIPYEVVIRPWKRCLNDAINGDIHIVLDAASNNDRKKKYLLTKPIYRLTPVFFFDRELVAQYPEPVTAKQLHDLNVCGQSGYIYNNFGFDEGTINLASKDITKIVELVLLKRCNIGLARNETLKAELKRHPYADQVAIQHLSNTPPELFYWMINRSSPFAQRIKEIIDQDIQSMQKNGALPSLLHAYLE